jgi:hypothetical protein
MIGNPFQIKKAIPFTITIIIIITVTVCAFFNCISGSMHESIHCNDSEKNITYNILQKNSAFRMAALYILRNETPRSHYGTALSGIRLESQIYMASVLKKRRIAEVFCDTASIRRGGVSFYTMPSILSQLHQSGIQNSVIDETALCSIFEHRAVYPHYNSMTMAELLNYCRSSSVRWSRVYVNSR